MAVVYHDALDTVRTSNERAQVDRRGVGTAHLHAKGSLILYALLGCEQRISQSQAFDSAVILEACTNDTNEERDAFLELVKRGVFQIALFNHDSLLSAFRSRLETMELSSWPEIDRPEIRNPVTDKVEQSTGPVRAELIKFVDNAASGQDLPASVKANVEALRELDAAIKIKTYKHPKAVLPPPEYALMNWISEERNRVRQTEPETSSLSAGLKQLDELRSNDRSKHYAAIRSMDIPDEDKKDLKSIVDLGYNRVVARSLKATQFSLTTPRPRTLQSLNRFGQPSDSLELITAENFPGIEKATWANLLRFLNDCGDRGPRTRLREALAARFLARVSATQSGWAVIPSLSATIVELLKSKAISTLVTLFGEGLPPFAEHDVDEILSTVAAVELSIAPAESAAEKTRDLIAHEFERRYKGMLVSSRMVPCTDMSG